MPFGKHLFVKSAGYGILLAELVPVEIPDQVAVSDQEMDETVRSLLAESSQGAIQAFSRCASARRRWVAVFSEGHPTGHMEAGMLDEEDLRDIRSAASSDPVVGSRLRMVEAFLSRDR